MAYSKCHFLALLQGSSGFLRTLPVLSVYILCHVLFLLVSWEVVQLLFVCSEMVQLSNENQKKKTTVSVCTQRFSTLHPDPGDLT